MFDGASEYSESICIIYYANRIMDTELTLMDTELTLRAYSVTELSLIKSWFDEGQFGLQGTTQRD